MRFRRSPSAVVMALVSATFFPAFSAGPSNGATTVHPVELLGARTDAVPTKLVISFLGRNRRSPDGNPCGAEYRTEVDERSRTVSVRVFEKLSPDAAAECQDPLHYRTGVVHLKRPLGSRQLKDERTHAALEVFDGTHLSSLRARDAGIRQESSYLVTGARGLRSWVRVYRPANAGDPEWELQVSDVLAGGANELIGSRSDLGPIENSLARALKPLDPEVAAVRVDGSRATSLLAIVPLATTATQEDLAKLLSELLAYFEAA